jgi:hypothetical protein
MALRLPERFLTLIETSIKNEHLQAAFICSLSSQKLVSNISISADQPGQFFEAMWPMLLKRIPFSPEAFLHESFLPVLQLLIHIAPFHSAFWTVLSHAQGKEAEEVHVNLSGCSAC